MSGVIRRGVDYSTRPSSWEAFFDELKVRGYSVIGRYLGPPHWTKAATKEELDAAFARGFQVFFWWETTEERSLSGYEGGVVDANRALGYLRDLGLPDTLPVYYTVDFDASGTQLRGPIRAYFEGIRAVVPLEQIGVYGGWRTIEYVMGSGLARYAAQTEAWSYLNGLWPTPPVWHPQAQIRQWTVHGPGVIAGVSCDGLDIVAHDIGAYHPQGGDDMTPEQDKLLRQCRLSDVARSYDVKIIRAEIRGDAAEAARLEAEKAAEVAKVRAALGLD